MPSSARGLGLPLFRMGLRLLLGTLLVWAGLSTLPAAALAQSPTAAPIESPKSVAPGPASSAAVSPAEPTASRSAGNANNKRRTTKPLWTELTAAQQQALGPLASTWDTVSQAQKRKWLALSENFPAMSGAEQAKLHSRMSEWAALSPQQRTQARLNFAETQQLAPDDKKAKWEAYQALPPEEKRKLADTAPKPPATAAAVKPVPPEKLADVPKSRRAARSSRTAATPDPAGEDKLPPQPPPSPGGGQGN